MCASDDTLDPRFPLITPSKYYAGKETECSRVFTREIAANVLDLLTRVNALLLEFNPADFPPPYSPFPVIVNSGWRPSAKNIAVGGAPHSYHLTGQAIDINDKTGILDRDIMTNSSLLEKHGLWLEHPMSTPGWVHLDTGDRPARKVRIFKI